jgi:hypothetical protein
VTIDSYDKIIRMYQDGVEIGKEHFPNRLKNYKNEEFFYLGVGDEKRKGNEKYFKGLIDSFAIFSNCLSDDEIYEISNNKTYPLTMNFGKYFSQDLLSLYYDANSIENYKLTDLSGNNNDGEIVNCEIVDVNYEEYTELLIPFRREGCTFELLPHEENGFVDNKWKTKFTRYNQLRFYNEVSENHRLLYREGLSTLKFTEHGINIDNKITQINVGI